jgi:hypothetical protein
LHNLYLVYSGTGNLNWFQFSGASQPLPSPWIAADVGTIGLAGGNSFSNGTFTVNGSGDDIWNAADAFHYVQQPVGGPCEIRARVVNVQNTDPWAKAGVMLREGAAAGARNVAVVVTAGNGMAFQVRASTGAATTSTVLGGITAPRWVRLVRAPGNLFAGYYSSDATNWNQIGTNTLVSMSNGVSAGLAVTAHNNASNCSAVFDNVAVNQAPVLASLPNQTILAGRVLTVTNSATDADVPAQTLKFNLLNGPTGAVINTNTGLLTWRPAIAQSPSTQTVAVVVSDSGLPTLGATQSFLVSVTRPAVPTLAASANNGLFGLWLTGETGPDYTIQTSTNLISWASAAATNSPALPWYWVDTNAHNSPWRFYRALLGP